MAVVVGLVLAVGACSVVNDPARRETDLRRLSALLAQKRAVARAASPHFRDFDYGTCPEALLGASMEQIEARLGTTHCSKTQPTCVYAFYYEPAPATDGGGPELALTFDETGRVSDVDCYTVR
ncbi:MAG TPA: hypothetical protein VHM25_02370 [Polyangiaceae bacterium]|jgi:hypothetical protein|nr:hypothetical protein [Polyangiaceae bacterium]